MSALPPKADMSQYVGQCPLCARSGHWTGLLDHLVGADEQCGRNVEAERLGSLEIDDRQVGRLLTLEDAVDVGGGAPELIVLISGGEELHHGCEDFGSLVASMLTRPYEKLLHALPEIDSGCLDSLRCC